MIVALIALFVGGVLLYAGVTGKSVTALLTGNSQAKTSNKGLGA